MNGIGWYTAARIVLSRARVQWRERDTYGRLERLQPAVSWGAEGARAFDCRTGDISSLEGEKMVIDDGSEGRCSPCLEAPLYC